MREEKKRYLSLYIIQEPKISRLKKMSELNPENAEKYSKDMETAYALRKTIEEKISAVDGGRLSELLFQKYVFGKTLEEISLILNYSLRQTERLHIEALDKFQI